MSIVLIDQFTKTVGEEKEREKNYYIRLSVEDRMQAGLPFSVPESIVIEERVGKSVVQCSVTFKDTTGMFINAAPVKGDYEFELLIGKGRKDFRSYTLVLDSIKADNMNLGESDNYLITLRLISDYWQEMTSKRESKAWRNFRLSEAVEEIFEDTGLEDVYVEPTNQEKSQLVCPYWTNKEMLDYICSEYKPENNDSFYVYGATNNGIFFSSMDNLIDNPLEGIFIQESQDPRRFRVSGDKVKGYEEENPDLNVIDFRVTSNYSQTMRSGASGVHCGFYDFMNDRYHRETKTFSDSDERQLSDWSYISDTQESPDVFMFGHRSMRTEDKMEVGLSKKVNDVVEVSFSINGSTDIHIGEIVDVLIPISPEFLNIKYNEIYNGKYLVIGKRTVCDLETSSVRTVFKLTRQGINGIELSGLSESSSGKVV